MHTTRRSIGAELGDEGVEEAFDLVAEISERYTPSPTLSSITDLPSAFRLVDGSEIVSFTPHQPTS
jgi:hypothetical protein